MMRRLGPLALLALSGWACGEPRLLDSFTEGLTRIRLVPREFTGSVECRRGIPGALQSYSVRLQEIYGDPNTDAGVVTAFATGAIPCDQAVMFPSFATRSYAAEIRGFDREVSDDEVDTVPARWTATCGKGGEGVPDAGLDPLRPTVSVRGLTVPMRGCSTLVEVAPGSVVAQLVVDQPSALGTLRCGLGAGEVARLEATFEGVTSSALCGDPLAFDVSAAGRYHTIALTGFEVGADAGALPDAATGVVPPPVAPPGPSSSDASAADAGDPLDASVVPLPEPDAGMSPVAPIVGVARWRTQCVGRSVPGAQALVYCDPFQRLP